MTQQAVTGPARFALTITDALGTDAAAARIGTIQKRTLGLSNFSYLCIRDDLRVPDAFADICGVASVLWEGGLILESEEPESLAKGLLHLVGREPILHCRGCMDEAMLLSRSFGCRIIGPADSDADILDIGTSDMGECPDSIYRLRPLSKGISVSVPAGEYGVSMAAVAVLSGADIIIADDMDEASCRLLDSMSSGRKVRGWE